MVEGINGGQENGDPSTGVPTLTRKIAGAVTGVVALLAFFGIEDAALDRVVRNNPKATTFATVVLILGVGLALSSLALSRSTRVLVLGLVSSTALVAAGAMVALHLSVASKAAKDRPIVGIATSVADGAATVSFSATASGLTSRETLTVDVEGLHSTQPVYRQVMGQFGTRNDHREFLPIKIDPNDATEEYVSRLSYAFVGPDAAGVADYEGTVVVPLGHYERVRVSASVLSDPKEDVKLVDRKRCSREALNRGCAAVALPPPPLRPTLVTSLTPGDQPVLSATIGVDGISVSDVVVVTVRDEIGETWPVLAVHELTADAQGRIEQTVMAPAVAAGMRLCITAVLVHRTVENDVIVPPPSPPTEESETRTEASGRSSAPPAQASQPSTSAGDSGSFGAPRTESCSTGWTGVSSELLVPGDRPA